MGPPSAAEILRESLYRGADRAVLLSDRKFAGADTLATSYALACAIRKLGALRPGLRGPAGYRRRHRPGRAPDRREAGHTPDHLRRVHSRARRDSPSSSMRALDHGTELVRCSLPCLLTVVSSANEPRPASVRRRIEYKLASTSLEYKSLLAKWPSFGTRGGPRRLPRGPQARDPHLVRRRYRRRGGQARLRRLPDPGAQDQLRRARGHGEQGDQAYGGGHQGPGRGAGQGIHRRIGGK